MLTTQVIALIRQALPPQAPESVEFRLETPPDPRFGDLACNVALVLSKSLSRPPRELATEIASKLDSRYFAKVEIAGPGFLNLFLQPALYQEALLTIEQQGSRFGSSQIGGGQKVLLEFISANPTGPLTVANGRGGYGGDVLARVLRRAGFTVSTEYYINDAGNQVVTLGKSLQGAGGRGQGAEGEDESLYQGEYIRDLAAQFPDKITEDAYETGRAFAAILLETEIQPAVAEMGVQFDRWFHEYELHDADLIARSITQLGERVFSLDGALWLRTTDYGDDKDRVLRKSTGEWTYFAADIAYHADKFTRADRLINIWGADHHGYVPRMQAAAACLGRAGDLSVIITQLVKLFRDGVEYKMSKRAGNFELMRDLIAEVGSDAVRWFFVMREWNTHLNFDLDLAKAESADNPVYYVQYAHARIASILAKAAGVDFASGDLSLLTHASELALIKKIAELPELVVEITQHFGVNKLTNYARELAEAFHRFYTDCRVIDPENPELTKARLRLAAAAKEVLRIVLAELVGVSAPEQM